MSSRFSLFGAVAVLGTLIAACGPARQTNDAGPHDSGFACVGACNPGDGGGGDGGSGGGGGSDGGIATKTIAQVKQATFKDHVRVDGVVVTVVDYNKAGGSAACTGASPPGWYAEFWVVDPADPSSGIWVDKYCTDLPTNFQPVPGDVLTIDGYFYTSSKFDDRSGYRYEIVSQYGMVASNAAPLVITKTGTQSPPLVDVEAPTGFGNSDGGRVLANREFSGARVHVPGPLVVTDPNPVALKRVSGLAGDTVHFGFEVTGGILVDDYRTYGVTLDGGTPRCDYRAVALDGGSVAFPNGISGVWDSYTHAPCEDGGTNLSACYLHQVAGYVPGTLGAAADGGNAKYTFVLYPMDCAHDFEGATGL